MLLLLTLSCTSPITCGAGTVLRDGVCEIAGDSGALAADTERDGEDTAIPPRDSGPADSGLGDGGGETGGAEDSAACEPASLWSVEVEGDPDLVNQVAVQIALDGVDQVALRCALTEPPPEWAVWVPPDATWRYLDTDEPPGDGWQDPGFDDSAWAEGSAPLGYGDDQTTVVDYGGKPDDKYITTWFRGTFTLGDPAAVADARLRVQRDDGLIVSVNGVEVLRDNLPAGEVDADTLATATVSGSDETNPLVVSLDPALLVKGENTLAAEVHQADPTSSDLRFGLALEVAVPGVLEPEDEEVHSIPSGEPAPVHEFLIQGLLADATYSCEPIMGCPGSAPEPFAIHTEPLPDELPSLEVSVPAAEAAWGDYTLLNHGRPCGGDDQNRLLIVDHQGRVRWYLELEGLDQPSTIDLESQYLGAGRIAWGGGDQPEGSPQLVDLSGERLYTAAYPGADEHIYHHDIEVLDDGRILGLINTSDSAAGQSWEGFALIEHDPETLEVTWAWYSQDAFRAGELSVDSGRDPWHANALTTATDAEGEAVYVSLLTTEEIIRVDRATGAVSWHLGVGGDFELVDAAGAPLDDSGWFRSLHGIDVTDDGALMVYDNGAGQSRALRYRLDTANRIATLEWSYTEPGWSEPIWGDADQLASGSVLINMAHAWCWGGSDEHWGSLVEVDPADNSILWRVDFTSADDSSYRAQKLDGCEVFRNATACPALLE